MKTWKRRLAGLFAILALVSYLPWLFTRLNWQAPWLALPFAIATVLMAVLAIITVINHWHYHVEPLEPLFPLTAPDVAVIIPTYGEPAEMVAATVRSVMDQEYPVECLTVIVSDDGHRLAIRELVAELSNAYPDTNLLYHEPHRRGDPARRGDAKAGNLNSALDLINGRPNPPAFIETRDADDLVGDPRFLTAAIGHLLRRDDVGFVQTIKEARVSSGDPFGNLEQLFYRQAMYARHAADAVFPCGSGLVWRRAALLDIGGFPSWNLVEDLQSGIEALRRGWRGSYLPLVGAVGQTAPEDIANSIKQRGTWALDTMRITFWGDKTGLSLRQHLQFAELGFFYLMSFAVLIFAATPVFALAFGVYPLITTHLDYALRFWPLAVAMELLLVSMSGDLPYESLWRARETWLGMAPVYARATLLALIFGPNRKPTYRVTRKKHIYRWYWREILPQLVLFLSLIGASLYHVATESLLFTADLGSLFWAAYFVLGLSHTITNSWHGLTFKSWLANANPAPNRLRQAIRSRFGSD
jgi:cellulose synthase (UDP-forming)